MDFTLKKYQKLVNSLKPGDYTLLNHLKNGGSIVRHDVDRSVKNALSMARIEAQNEIKTTYYFRVPKTFKPKEIDRIKELGHEIGYHYEVLDKAKGNKKKAIQIFRKEWELFKRWESHTICMHGNPLTKYDNRDLWGKFQMHKEKVMAEAYLSINFNKIKYFTDTGRSWNNKKYTLKDITGLPFQKIKDTNHLIRTLKNNGPFYILAHPCRWNDNLYAWTKELIGQSMKNIIKRIIKCRS